MDLSLGSTDVGTYNAASDPTLQFSATKTPQFNDSAWSTYAGPLMAITGLIAGVGNIFNDQNQAAALKTQAGFNQFQAQQNLQRTALSVEQTKEQEGTELLDSGAKSNAVIGNQRAGAASQNIGVNSGTILAEQQAQGRMSNVDAMTIRRNAAMKAYGIQVGGIQEAGQEQLEAAGEQGQASQYLSSGGAQAANALMSQMDQYESMRARGF